jgi:hypothetical protein
MSWLNHCEHRNVPLIAPDQSLAHSNCRLVSYNIHHAFSLPVMTVSSYYNMFPFITVSGERARASRFGALALLALLGRLPLPLSIRILETLTVFLLSVYIPRSA